VNMENEKDFSNSDIQSLPQIKACRPLERISFSNYSGMKYCLLKGLPLSCIEFTGQSPLFLKSKAQLLGIFLHSMLERVFELRKCDRSELPNRLKKEFIEQLLKLEEHAEYSWRLGTNTFSKLPEVGVIFGHISDIVFAERILEQKDGSMFTISPEKALTSKDKLLFGKVDVLMESDEEIIIIEYKTGSIFEDAFLKNEYFLQVHFYAELVHEKYGKYPNYLLVKETKGKQFKMPPDIEEAKRLGRHAREILNRYNSIIRNNEPLENIAKASNEACPRCHYQQFCPEYWANYNRIEMTGQIQSLKIRELELIQGISSYKSSLKAQILGGRLNGKQIIIDGFYPKRFTTYEHHLGRELILTNLMVNYEKPSGHFTETSQIYKV
jgi:hypothetical protein